jgi:hypothetical protein
MGSAFLLLRTLNFVGDRKQSHLHCKKANTWLLAPEGMRSSCSAVANILSIGASRKSVLVLWVVYVFSVVKCSGWSTGMTSVSLLMTELPPFTPCRYNC